MAADLCELFLSTVTGFCDTYSPFMEIVPSQKSYSQNSLVDNLIGSKYQAHNSLSDEIALQALLTHFNMSANVMLHRSFSMTWLVEHVKYLKDRNCLMLTLAPMLEIKIVSKGIAKKISGSGLTYHHLASAFARKGKDGLVSLLAEKDINGKARMPFRMPL